MLRTEKDLYMTYEEYESFKYTESEIQHVICSDCGYIESTDEELDCCSECGGGVTYDLDIEGCECKGCKEEFEMVEEFYSNAEGYLCETCYEEAIPMDPKKGQSLAECVREYEEEVY